MGRAGKTIGVLAVVVLATLVVSGNDPFDPGEIEYDSVPGYGAKGGTDIFEWTEKSKSAGNEPTVTHSTEPGPGLRLRWLGTAGFELSDDKTTILIDPFVSRPPVPEALFDELPIDTNAVDRYILDPIKKQDGGLDRIKAILISHTHYDHVQDAPYILAKYKTADSRPLIVGDRNVADVLKRYSGRAKQVPWLQGTLPLEKGRQFIIPFDKKNLQPTPLPSQPLAHFVGQFGDFSVTAFVSWHGLYDDFTIKQGWFNRFLRSLLQIFRPDRYLSLTLQGDVTGKPPYHSTDLRAYLNTSMTYLIEYKKTFRIFAVDSPRFLQPDDVSREVMKNGRIDVLLEGIASRKFDNAIPKRISGFQPAYLVPTHFDNFFVPIPRFKIFDYKLMLKTDNSNLKGFIEDYQASATKLRMMKMFYYYSMEPLLPPPGNKS